MTRQQLGLTAVQGKTLQATQLLNRGVQEACMQLLAAAACNRDADRQPIMQLGVLAAVRKNTRSQPQLARNL